MNCIFYSACSLNEISPYFNKGEARKVLDLPGLVLLFLEFPKDDFAVRRETGLVFWLFPL